MGERPTAAFPSSHVGISTIVMIMAYRVNKKLCYFLASFYVLLCCATVYIQAHYLVDVIAGWISAVCIYIVATYMYKRWFASVAVLYRRRVGSAPANRQFRILRTASAILSKDRIL